MTGAIFMSESVIELDRTGGESLVAINIETCGLGNRVHFTLSAASVAAATNRTLQVYWPTDDLFACPAGRIWKNFPGEMIKAYDLSRSELGGITDWRTLTPESWSTIADQTVFLRGYGGIPQPIGSSHWGELFQELELTSEVRGLVEKTWKVLSRDSGVLGVSMRVNEKSHAKTKTHSPVGWYIAELERFSTTHPTAGIFLSCDEASVTAEMKSRFPNIVTVDHLSAYNSVEGVLKAVADLYILASSTAIISPYWSSFPNMSYQLADQQVPMRNTMRSWPRTKSHGPTIASDPVWPSRDRLPIEGWSPFN